MIKENALAGELDGVDALIENSSGNTVFSLAIAARQFGVDKTYSYVPAEISWIKLLMLLFFGVEPIVNQEPTTPTLPGRVSEVCRRIGISADPERTTAY